ncbi:GntR family transcriptional regulator [Gracilibacillus halophilus YIM-C55.5]|uniref:GntR family transcriptional regulator n=1 Tax=Gracilibacillus halophilus YIM-C55.5 TaxID=1308866 RepID=N4WVN2_9BACI|nr:GntR family transcriptional regulator [Gracilibacillus halophilus]ENH97136.1 GntR family transcriptional regulator [Gracilibacillus halophilus YIM-C55.5]
MPLHFQSDKPIYLQIVDTMIHEIVRGRRFPGDKLPSVREYAVEVGVNPNTMQRVYRELDARQITKTKRGQGTFVTDDEETIQQLREQLKQRYIDSFLTDMTGLGFTIEEIISSIDKEKGGTSDDSNQ